MKEILRQKLLRERSALPESVVAEKSGLVQRQLISLPCWRNAKTVMLYSAQGNEVETKMLLEAAFAQGKKVCLPCLTHGEMSACAINSLEEIISGRDGFACGKIVSPSEIGLVVVPGVAFDVRGNRLGRGKGFYDAFLKRVSCAKVGVAFEQQVVAAVPADARDERVDKIITEKRVVDCVNEVVRALAFLHAP